MNFKQFVNENIPTLLKESRSSDAYEVAVAKVVDDCIQRQKEAGVRGVKDSDGAERPKVGTQYSDVKVQYKGKAGWIEVKMNHTDQLGNPRFFFENGRWGSTYNTPLAKTAVEWLNQDREVNKFIKDLAKFLGKKVKDIALSSLLSNNVNNIKGYVTFEQLKEFIESTGRNQYIMQKSNIDVSELVRAHYSHSDVINGPKADYIQTGNDLYRLSDSPSFQFDVKDIPLYEAIGHVHVRLSSRKDGTRYEIQLEAKADKIKSESPYSLAPENKRGSKKLPFKLK